MGKNEQKNFGQVGGRLAASRSLIQGLVSTARRGGLPFAPAKGSKTGQRGTKLSPLQTPLTLSCGWIRTMQGIVRTAPQIRSQGACGAFYLDSAGAELNAPAAPYQRRLIPLRKYEVFPGGGAPTRRGLGAQPQAYFGSFCTHKRNAPAASRTGFAPCKINAMPLGDHKLSPAGQER